MANIPWGKPRLFAFCADEASDHYNDGKAYEIFTPVEDSTQLSSEKGDKLEAKIEGGENEDVKYKRSTYSLAFNIRKAKGRRAPFPSEDGVVNDHYGILLMPEDDTTEGFLIEKNTASIDDTFTAGDGAIWNCQLEAVKPEEGDTVKWGRVQVSNGKVLFTERSSVENGGTAVTKEYTLATGNDGGCPTAGKVG